MTKCDKKSVPLRPNSIEKKPKLKFATIHNEVAITTMRKPLVLLLALMWGVSLCFAAKVNGEKSITVNGESRSYILYVPDNVSASPALVFSLHGASGHSSDYSPFQKSVADSKGCIVVYPQGNIQDFGPFGKVPGWAAFGEENEDLDFFKAIINQVTGLYPQIDKNRIYCCGFSNGGMMTYSNSNTASDIFAAFASISGYPINEMHLHHHGARPVPFLHIHGKSDDFVVYSLMGTIRDNMVARNGCNPVPTVTKTSTYTKSVYAAGEGGFPYVYYEVEGMGHNDYTDRTEDGNSALTMWKFMSQYTLSDACDKTLKWNPNLDADGFLPKEHGWSVSGRGTRYVYGDATATQNVCHSLQFAKGSYQLRLETSGSSAHHVTIKLASTDGTQVFCKSVSVGGKFYIPFTISPDFGEYTITILKEDADDKFVSLGAYMTTATWSGATKVTSADVEMPAQTLVEVKKNVPLTQTDSSTQLCDKSTSGGVTTFTIVNSGDVEVVYKMLDVDVKGYDKVVVTFAEPLPTDLLSAFGSAQPTVDKGTTTYAYDITPGTATLSEIALIALFKGAGTTIKVKSVDLVKYVEEGDEEDDEETPSGEGLSKIVPLTQSDSGTTKYAMTTSGGVTSFVASTSDYVQVVYKMLNVDVRGYEQVVVTFAEPLPTDLLSAFGSSQPTLASGITSYTYDIPLGTSTLSEIALIALGKPAGTTVKVTSVKLVDTNGNVDGENDGDDDTSYVFPDANGENSTLFSVKKDSFIPNIYASGKYLYDASEQAWYFSPGQYGFGGWRSETGFDVSQYRTLRAVFAEAPSNGVTFRAFKQYDYWNGETIEVACDGKTSVDLDISDIDRLYFVGFWAYGSEDASRISMKLKRVTLVPFDKGDANKDGVISVSDVPSLINQLHGSTNAWHLNVDGNEKVDKSDVDALVDKLLEAL